MTLRTEHFRVTFPPRLETLGRHAAARAELARSRLARYVAKHPEGRVDVVVTDNTDIANGFATPFFSNRVVIFAPPPVNHLALSFNRDWIDMVLVHELAHIYHLDVEWGRLPWLRDIFGRVPIPWLFFPAVGSPGWAVEGLATLVESEFTGAGRTYGSYHEMVIRTAVVEGAFDGIDRASGSTPIWPAGHRRYIYGSLFMEFLTERFGEDAVARVVRETANAWIPPQLWFDRVGTNAFGTGFTDAWRAWRAGLDDRYRALADSLERRGLTRTTRVHVPGRYAFFPRVSPDGSRLAYALDDGREEPATALVDLSMEASSDREAGSRLIRRWRRNSGGLMMDPASWLPDGSGLVTAQLEFGDPYHLYQDLYLLDEAGEHRLTRGLRIGEPHVHPDGDKAVAVQNRSGANRLVVVELENGAVHPLTDFQVGRSWALPRWSPDGSRIAVGLWRLGGLNDVVVLDSLGRLERELTRDLAVDMAPAWSPDGRWVLFSSDRSGITDLYAYDMRADRPRPLRRVTRLLTGGYYPEVSPDGRRIYFSAYHADGFHLERVPFEPGTWRPAEPPLERFIAEEELASPILPPAGGAEGETLPGRFADGADGEIRPYSALPTLRPHFWLPLVDVEDGPEGERPSYGLFTAGSDAIGRHAIELALLYDPEEGLARGFAGYVWAGLGNPVLRLAVSRDWDFLNRRELEEGGRADIFLREDEISLSGTLRRVRWRTFASITAGAELEDEEAVLRNATEGVAFGEDADVEDRLLGIFGRVSLATSQRQAFSISREDGVNLSLLARRRWEVDPVPGREADYWELAPQSAGYLSFPVFGFADHVLAMRARALWRDGRFAPLTDLGGAPGVGEATLLGEVGGGSGFLPLRGFAEGVRLGTQGWIGSLEYRLPVALVGGGIGLLPLFLDRISLSFFADGGDLWCDAAQLEARGEERCSPRTLDPLLSAGGELALDGQLLYSLPLRLRVGIGVPLRSAAGEDAGPRFYVRLGPSF